MPDRRRETVWFIVLALLISWGVGALWLLNEKRFILIRIFMCVPGLVGFGCAWFFRREPPRAVGLAFTEWKHWFAAIVYPIAIAIVAVALAYGIRSWLNRPDFIIFQPELLKIGPLHGLQVLPAFVLITLVMLLPWLLVAGAYRWNWPDRIKAKLPEKWRWLHHGFRAALWIPTFFIHGVPGELGEELGWRGHLVRRWQERPITAALITMPVWAAFHLPVIFSSTQRGHGLQNVTFLLAIAMAAVVFAAFYVWTRSVWPCAVLHLSWNLWNPVLLGDVYRGHPGLFGGKVWIFNGEGVFGLLLEGIVAILLFRHWRHRRK